MTQTKTDELNIYQRYIKAQAEMTQPVFDSVNPHFKNRYASLSAVIDSVLPALNANGLGLIQRVVKGGEMLLVQTEVFSEDGDVIYLGEYPVTVGAPQTTASNLTYAKRYALCAGLCRCGEPDLDGEVPKAVPSGKFVAKCRTCGARYEFDSEQHMKRTKCCEKPDWQVE